MWMLESPRKVLDFISSKTVATLLVAELVALYITV